MGGSSKSADVQRRQPLFFGLLSRTIFLELAKVFLLSPPNVTVAAEDKARLVEGGFFNQS